MGQETRNLEVELNEELNRAATSRQILKHLEPDVQAIQGRKDLEAKVDEYTQCKHFRVRFSSLHFTNCLQSIGLRRKSHRTRESRESLRYR